MTPILPIHLLQASRFWDPNIIELIEGIQSILPRDGFVSTAREVAAAFSLVYLSIRAYAMIIGEGRFEVMQLFRPFVITLVIVNFSLYANLAGYPAKAAGNAARTSFEAKASLLQDKMDEKEALNEKLFQALMEQTNQIARLYGGSDGSETSSSWMDLATLGTRQLLSELTATITVYEQMLWVKVSLWIQNLIMWVVVGVFKGVCYCIFFIQLILLHILLVLGPLSFAFSVGGAFRDSWVTWTARYISVTFFNTIGFMILNISTAIITYGLQQEIDRLNFVLSLKGAQEQFIAVASNTDGFIGYLFVALLTSLGGIASVPVISTWIIQTAGTGNVMFGAAVHSARAAATGGAATVSRRLR
jgi:hypothetical protein